MPESAKTQFNALVKPHLKTLFRVAYRLVRNTADAQDLVQDACVAALGNLAEVAAADSPLRWLLRVQQNRFIDGVRRRHNSPVVSDEDTGDIPILAGEEPLDPEQLLQQAQNEEILERSFLQLDEMQRTLLVLRMEGYDLPEIEAITGIDRKVLSKRLQRARRSLARHVTEQMDATPHGHRARSSI